MKTQIEIEILKEGDSVNVLRWAAQSFTTTYYYFRNSLVCKNKRTGKLFLKPFGASWGRRGNGTLLHRLPATKMAVLSDRNDGRGYTCRIEA